MTQDSTVEGDIKRVTAYIQFTQKETCKDKWKAIQTRGGGYSPYGV